MERSRGCARPPTAWAAVARVSTSGEGVGAAADHVVCFYEEHAAIVSREQRRRAEAADAGADDDGIIIFIGICSLGLAAWAWCQLCGWSQGLRARAEQHRCVLMHD